MRIKLDKKRPGIFFFLLKIFGVSIIICIFAHEIFKIYNYGNTSEANERADAARIR